MAGKVTAGVAGSNGNLPVGLRLWFTCGLTAHGRDQSFSLITLRDIQTDIQTDRQTDEAVSLYRGR